MVPGLPSSFARCRRSTTGQWEGLRVRLGFHAATVSFFLWYSVVNEEESGFYECLCSKYRCLQMPQCFSTFGVMLYMWMRRKVDCTHICAAWLYRRLHGSDQNTGSSNQEPWVQDCWLFVSSHNNIWHSKAIKCFVLDSLSYGGPLLYSVWESQSVSSFLNQFCVCRTVRWSRCVATSWAIVTPVSVAVHCRDCY